MESPVRVRGSPPRRSPSRRERRNSNADKFSSRNRTPKRHRSGSPVHHSPVRDKPSDRTRSSKHRKSPSLRSPTHSPVRQTTSHRIRSPEPQSTSPRGKRLKRAKAERDAEKGSEREHDKNHGKKSYRGTHEGKELDRDLTLEKSDRRSQRDAAGSGSRSRHRRSSSPSDHHHRGQRRSRSPHAADDRDRDELAGSRDSEQRNGGSDSIAKMKVAEEKLEAKEKQKPSFELSGKLAAETNRVRGVTLLYSEEPPDARKPDIRWRLYVFKAGEVLNEPLYVHRQSFYLFGRERKVADIPTDHPSCSKQHAVLQYRQVEQENPNGTMSKQLRPYLMDLGSTNGTFINDDKLEPKRYYELFEKDTIKFGNSSREYVLLHENSAG